MARKKTVPPSNTLVKALESIEKLNLGAIKKLDTDRKEREQASKVQKGITTVEGELSIGRVHGDKDIIRIQILDKSSGYPILRAELSPEDFGNAVTGSSFRPCQVDVFTSCPLGKK
jgi:Asp-tRNA(Asn)/Glu-tRNA(Gln) amidotransferase A subunit family amidase